ncbi:MAG TPA: hypothetical protein PLX89_12650 [Verrucomicrobiota bacterium]|nr:hypothetical protein [Verrucomicrobiales bacterium]HRI13841.1 hypothetical protein [Verrucomicrobiota bacterium]
MHAAFHFLEQEALALLTRLDRVKPFALQMTSVLAAAVSPGAQTAIERHLADGRRELRQMVRQFLAWLRQSVDRLVNPAEAQRRFTLLRLRFNAVLSQFDIFADALVQRSEHEYGTWLGGLDIVAADALSLPGFYEAPPVVCYLDRGAGAAIRRARTRLPGGGQNPVAVIRIPRERMVGSGIASSLVHEVGHQAAALLDLVNSLRPVLRAMQMKGGTEEVAWRLWERWLSEVVADFWAVAKVGIAATTGLIAVVSVPRAFVFRINAGDPHPSPWIRVRLGSAVGAALYPDPQWDRLSALWEALYPRAGLDPSLQELLGTLEQTLPAFAGLLVNHRPRSLGGRSLAEALTAEERAPDRLRAVWELWRRDISAARSALPTLAFAVIGQARADDAIHPQAESQLLGQLLTFWALRGTLDLHELCAAAAQATPHSLHS